ncbi:MAG TPA: GNAT family N-acetyltransferase, partial [Ilumatobacteraceae bacterium]|nr:GNAT family N-acetyltransferase [Ilumatobacteraceae bacterium]
MTDRLQLEPLRPSHAAEMVTVLAASDLYHYTGGTPPTLDDLERRYAAQTAGSPTPGETWHNWIIRVPIEGTVGFGKQPSTLRTPKLPGSSPPTLKEAATHEKPPPR